MKKYLISALTILLMACTFLSLSIGTNYLLELLIEDYYLETIYSNEALTLIVVICYVIFLVSIIGCVLIYKKTARKK